MASLTTHLEALMRRELRAFARELALLPDDTQLWTTVPGVTNSVGTLAAHVCGNLQHFIGAVLGSTGYVRDREHEFARRSGSRAELQRELEATADVIGRVLPSLTDAQLAADYPVAFGGRRFSTELFLLHLSVHLAMHLGQAGYLRRVLTGGSAASADPVSMRELGEPA